MESRFSYDHMDDSLIISKKAPEEKVKQNFMFGDLILSLTNSGKIVGLEVRDVSNFLKEMGIDNSILNDIQKVSLNITEDRGMILVNFILQAKNKEQIVPVTRLPLQAISC